MKIRNKFKNIFMCSCLLLISVFSFSIFKTEKANATAVIGTISSNDAYVYTSPASSGQSVKYLYITTPRNFSPTDSSSYFANFYYVTFSGNGTYNAYYNSCFVTAYVENRTLQFDCSGRYVGGPGNSTTYNSNDTALFNMQPNADGEWVINAKLQPASGSASYFTFKRAVTEDYNVGYDQGYDIGYDEGYDTGYDEGTSSSNTLVGMVGAIFTGPVTMFQQIFDFNILGINFAEMLFGLVTLLVVIWLIKRFV